MRRVRIGTAAVLGLILTSGACRGLQFFPWLAEGEGTYLAASATIEADEKTVAQILAAFNVAEEALSAGDLDRIMLLYSEGYAHHGLDKQGLRKIWTDLLHEYRNLATMHIFSGIKVEFREATQMAQVTCTGNFWGVSRRTGIRSSLDSWFLETHHLVFEQGRWRIRGHAVDTGRSPTIGPYQTPHPFF